MKLYLLNDSPVRFMSPWNCEGDHQEPHLYSKEIIIRTHLQPKYPGNAAEEAFCEQVKATNSSTEINCSVKLTLRAEPQDSRILGKLSVRLGRPSEAPSSSQPRRSTVVQVSRNSSGSSQSQAPKVKISILEKLQNVCPDARIKVSIKNFHPPKPGYHGGIDLTTNPMKLSSSNVNCQSLVSEVYPPEKFNWRPNAFDYTCRVTISVEVPSQTEGNSSLSLRAPASATAPLEPPWSRNALPGVQIAQEFSLNKRILDEALGSDVLITARNGAKIACHKSFLSAQSPVLKNYLDQASTGGDIKSLDMIEMSEEGVRAFLAHLYFWDITDALGDVNIAFELFTAARKYEVTSLEKSMTDVLLGTPSEQFDIILALQVFRAVRNLESAQALKFKITQSLMLRPEELRLSNDFRNLFLENPDDAMDLCLSFAILD